MQKYTEFFEVSAYENRELPLKETVYSKSDSSYTTYNYLTKCAEFNLPQEVSNLIKESFCYGVIPEIKSIWISHSRLYIYNYSSCVIKELAFSSKVQELILFKPHSHFFTDKIKYSLLVVSEKYVILYGIETESNEFIETGVSIYKSFNASSISITNGDIFLGGNDGNLYQFIYSNNNFLNLRTSYFKNLENNLIKRALTLFGSKNKPIKKISSLNQWVLALTDNEVKIYSLKNKEIKYINNSILNYDTSFIDIKAVEENQSSVFYYLINRTGKRYYFSNSSFLFEKRPPLEENDLHPLLYKGNTNGLLLYKKTGLAYFINLNEDVIRNYTLNKVVENYEVIKTEFDDLFLTEHKLISIKHRSLCLYEINDSEALLENCRPEETYTLIKNYGDKEIVSIFYSLLSKGKDVSRIEPLISKNESLRKQGFFLFVFRNVNLILNKEIDSAFFLEAERICKRLKNVLMSNYALNEEFSDEFIQSINFLKICYEYNLSLNFTFSDLLKNELSLKNESNLKNTLIKKLLTQFSGQIDTLENLLVIKCPKYINFDELYYFKGIEILDRNKSKENLYESLHNFKFVSHCLEEIIEKYLQSNFFVGAITILKKLKECKENDSFSKKIKYLKRSLKCKKSIEIGLENVVKEFSYVLFEALISNLLENEKLVYDQCLCCNTSFTFTFNDLLNLNSPFLLPFLKEKSEISLLEQEYNLAWKYLTIKGKNDDAVEILINIAETKPLSLDKRLNYLNIAYTLRNTKDIYIKIETLKIQQDFLKIKPNCMLENKLLSPTELFNDYLIPNKQTFLSLKLYDLFNYSDTALLNKLWLSILKNDLQNDLNVIKGLNLRNSALNLEIISKILLNKYTLNESNLVGSLVEIGFNRVDVLDYFEKLLKGTEYQHPNEKKKIMDVLVKAGDLAYSKRVKGFCHENYGI